MSIKGFYKNWVLAVTDTGMWAVANKQSHKVIYRGLEDDCSKVFIMLLSGFINENLEKIEAQ